MTGVVGGLSIGPICTGGHLNADKYEGMLQEYIIYEIQNVFCPILKNTVSTRWSLVTSNFKWSYFLANDSVEWVQRMAW